jgi:hypothetical protein
VRYIGWAAAIGLLCALPVASANDVAGNTDELTRVLGQARKPATLNALSMVQGCGPVGCGVTLGGLVIDTDTGSVRRSNGRLLSWVPTGAVADLAEVNWEPLRGYGERWPWCLLMAEQRTGSPATGPPVRPWCRGRRRARSSSPRSSPSSRVLQRCGLCGIAVMSDAACGISIPAASRAIQAAKTDD